ncbi:MAG: hypothetical protein A2Y93_14370 [Chloroflexi bacterium RBG_13_68_17]|nr:MAG: hypothetical protein A2Y93_14370 [Chloroflexi bacterium RBG_13_68_17]
MCMRRLLVLFPLILALTQPAAAFAGRGAQSQADAAAEVLASMTPEERVGQLFLVTFAGSNPGPDSSIMDLIRRGHISGVVLRARNDNFVDSPETVSAARSLIASLQAAEFQATQPTSSADGSTPEPGGVYIPLLIGLSQEGDGAPYAEIQEGLTELPSEMAIGATWDPNLAEEVGAILGGELEAIGVNLLLGPSLDVLENPQTAGEGDLGVRAFGGDPYWVSLMGEAYIRGVHAGSDGRVAVVAKHFPGHGGSDRPLEEEVATIRKSLEQLQRIELAPFFAVTAAAPGGEGVADAVLTSPIRYQGFQENIRATTRPVSLDAQAFGELMALEPLATWRAAGGVTVSDALGSRAVRRFYDPRGLVFRGPIVARDAFLAGNDLLYLGSFQGSDDPDEATTIRETLAFFVQRYREDPLFAERVDESALRVLRLKIRLYGETFDFGEVVPSEAGLEQVGQGGATVFRVARSAATQISPAGAEASEQLGGPPRLAERIVFFTDVRLQGQCSTCRARPTLSQTALEEAILRLYGPGASGEVGGWNLTSYTMADLALYFGEPLPSALGLVLTPPEALDAALRAADWLVFSFLGSNEAAYGSNALRLLLDRRPDLAQSARIVAIAFGAPYDLDATDISKLDAYFALYSKGAPFVEMAARLLFEEATASGAPPVSVPGIGYDLIEVTSPDPNQIIPLAVRPEGTPGTAEASPGGYTVGDIVRVEAGVVLDHNGHVVPDGTVVEISLGYSAESIPPMVVRATTVGGVAQADLALERFGLVIITAASDPARVSEILQLDVQEGVQAFVTVIAPSPVPTASPAATSTPAAGEASAPGEVGEGGERRATGILGWLLGVSGTALALVGRRQPRLVVLLGRPRVRSYLLVAIGGLLGVNAVGWGMGGAGSWGLLISPVLGLLGGAAGGVSDWLWAGRVLRATSGSRPVPGPRE